MSLTITKCIRKTHHFQSQTHTDSYARCSPSDNSKSWLSSQPMGVGSRAVIGQNNLHGFPGFVIGRYPRCTPAGRPGLLKLQRRQQ